MDSNEAKRILALYRPGDTDSPDSRMAQALKLAREDPQLAAWFGQHCAAHVKLATGAETPTSEPAAKEGPSPAPEQFILLNKPVMMMAGLAGLTLLALAVWTHFRTLPQNTFDNFRDRMGRLVQRAYPMKITTTDQAQIRLYLRAQGGVTNFSLPRNLEKLPVAGAAVLTWHDQPVSLVGLDEGGKDLYLFLIKKSTFANIASPTKPEFIRVGRLMTATWSQGETLYLLAAPLDEAELKAYIE